MRTSLLFILLFASFGHTQLSIVETDFFSAEDTARVSSTLDQAIDYTSTGANSVWDFSTLIANSQRLEKAYSISSAGLIVSFQFGPTAPPQYISSYYRPFDGIPFEDFTSFLPVNIEDINRIIKKDTDSLRYTGYSFKVDGQQVGFRSDTIETGYKFPMEFGDVYSSRGYTNMDFNPIFNAIFRQYRQRSSEVDGNGTLVLPNGTYNSLRVHHVINEQDSLYIDIQGFATWIPIERTTHEYEWWAKDEMRPVMLIQTEEINGSENVTSITYRDDYLGLDASLNNESAFKATIYPNPSKGIVNIKSELPIETIVIYDLQGQKIIGQDSQSNFEQIDTSELSPGVYNIVLTTSKGSRVSKLIVE